MYCDLQYFTR